MRSALFLSFLLLLPVAAVAQTASSIEQNEPSPANVPSGKQIFQQYCAACHGLDAKGHGPARAALKVPAANLTTLAKRHGGKFPVDYVTHVLEFGPGFPAHGAYNMPTWGPIFRYMDNFNTEIVKKRISNLCDYLATLQAR
ncbi:MAG: c-type cytochrome [Candidatus Acidiferrales bacterium]